MRTLVRPTLALAAVLALLLGAAACSSDDGDDGATTEAVDEGSGSEDEEGADEGDGDETSGGGDVPLDDSCVTDDPEAITASAVREYVNCVLTDEPVVGVGSSGSPDDPDQMVDLSTFEEGDVPLEVCQVASPLIFDELGLTNAEVTVLLVGDDGTGGDVVVERSGADGECTPT